MLDWHGPDAGRQIGFHTARFLWIHAMASCPLPLTSKYLPDSYTLDKCTLWPQTHRLQSAQSCQNQFPFEFPLARELHDCCLCLLSSTAPWAQEADPCESIHWLHDLLPLIGFGHWGALQEGRPWSWVNVSWLLPWKVTMGYVHVSTKGLSFCWKALPTWLFAWKIW